MNPMVIPPSMTASAGAVSTRPRLLYPALVVAAIAVTLLSLTGVAAMLGWLPGAKAEQSELVRQQATQCHNCGTVESVRLVEYRGQSSGVGAVAGGVAGAVIGNQIGNGTGRTLMTLAGAGGGAYLGNEIEKNTKRSSGYQIKVRMNDGSVKTVNQREVPDLRAGDKVRVSNGVVTQQG